jgi:hypothetical protein
MVATTVLDQGLAVLGHLATRTNNSADPWALQQISFSPLNEVAAAVFYVMW